MLKLITKAALTAAIVLSVSPTFAGSLDGAFGNTLLVSAGDAQTHIYPNKDGTYTGTSPDGQAIAGTWREDGDKICFTRSKPKAEAPICNALGQIAVGDTVTATGLGGAEVTLSLIKGR
ncbi:MAG: hypothetical protein P8Y45_02125 [Exilibacterium sp.]